AFSRLGHGSYHSTPLAASVLRCMPFAVPSLPPIWVRTLSTVQRGMAACRASCNNLSMRYRAERSAKAGIFLELSAYLVAFEEMVEANRKGGMPSYDFAFPPLL